VTQFNRLGFVDKVDENKMMAAMRPLSFWFRPRFFSPADAFSVYVRIIAELLKRAASRLNIFMETCPTDCIICGQNKPVFVLVKLF